MTRPLGMTNSMKPRMLDLFRTLRIGALAISAAFVQGFAGACGSGGGGTTVISQPKCTFANPLMAGADPWVVKKDATYHLIQSRQGGLWVSTSTKLTEVASNGTLVWTPPDTGWNRTNLWAPELHFIDGRWYIYYAARRAGPPFIHQRAGVLQSVGDDPKGPYV